MLHWRDLLQAAAQTVVILALTLSSAIPPSGVAASRPSEQTTVTPTPSSTTGRTETALPPSPSPSPTAAPETSATAVASPADAPPTETPPPTEPAPGPNGSAADLTGLRFTLAVEPASARPGDLVTYTASFTNAGQATLAGLVFADDLHPGLAFQPGASPDVALDAPGQRLTAALPPLAAGATVRLNYAFRVKGPPRLTEALLVNAAGVSDPARSRWAFASADLLLAAPGKSGGRVGPAGGTVRAGGGRLVVYVPPRATTGPRFVMVEGVTETAGEGYGLSLGVWQVVGPAADAADAELELVPAEPDFALPVTLEFSLDGIADLARLPADRAAYVVTRDEASGTWVRVPDVFVNPATNSVLVRTAHFSSWGPGVGPAFPEDGAGVLLFDQARPDLFTGRARFSLPIWTPPGPGGLAPDLTLSYSSGTADGVLRDVQAPWTGWGWALSTVEIAREITNGGCGPCGADSYGYANDFVLLFGGIGYPLIDSGDGRRYYTQDQTFLYVERHSAQLGNQGATTNATKEWWEVIARDGTAYRLGYNLDSEQLANMKGYPGAATGAWAGLGYAGAAVNRVAARWRVDRVTDPSFDLSGQAITFAYAETARDIAGAAGYAYDRASYLRTVAYSGYRLDFNRVNRGAFDMPATADLEDWSAWDDERLAGIDVVYVGTPDEVVRQYALEPVPADSPLYQGLSHQTLLLAGITVKGRVRQGEAQVEQPRVSFGYDNFANRGSCSPSPCELWAYPRLETIANGYGGTMAYEYESDGRTDTSWWYNWHVRASTITSGVPGAAPMKTAYDYADAKYVGGYTVTYHAPTNGWWSNDHHHSADEVNPAWPDCYPNPNESTLCRGPDLTQSDVDYLAWEASQGIYGHGDWYTAHYVRGAPEYYSYATNETAGELLGYGTVTETAYAADGVNVLAQTVHRFHTRDNLDPLPNTPAYQAPDIPFPAFAGREYRTEFKDAAGTVLRQLDTDFLPDYSIDHNGSEPGGDVHFVYAKTVDLSVRSGGGLALVSRTGYTRDTATGDLTWVKEYDPTDLATPYRQTHTTYLAETANHIGGKPRMQELLDGTGAPVARTYFAYDDTLTSIGARGLLTLVQAVCWFGSGAPPDCPGEATADTEYEYDDYGNRTRTRAYTAYGTPGTSPAGTNRLTETTYDSTLHTYPVAVTNALLQGTTTVYDLALGLPTDVTDPNGRTTTTTYDGLGRVSTITYHGHAQPNVKYFYPVPDGNGAVAAPFNIRLEAWDELGPGGEQYRAAWTIYDGLGRALQAQGPDEWGTGLIVTDTAYDARGLVQNSGRPRAAGGSGGTYFAPIWESLPHTATAYDALGRVTSVAHPGSGTEATSYDGLRTTRTDRNGHRTVQEADAFGRLAKVEEYMGAGPSYTLYATTTYSYDRRDLLTGVTDALGNVTEIGYDALGRKTGMTDSDMGTWSYVYDPVGNLRTQTDARGCTTALAYDGLNRLTGKTYAGQGACGATPAVTYTYDDPLASNGIGRRTGMTDASGTTAWGYDALGRATSETRTIDGTAYTVGRTFDVFGRLDTLTYPDGEVVTNDYNAMGALESVSSSLGATYASNLDYNAAGQVTNVALGNGVRLQDCYDEAGGTLRLTRRRAYPGALQSCTVEFPAGAALNLRYLAYDNAGNPTQIHDATRAETIDYAYDALDRLESASGQTLQSFGYNPLGNLIAKNGVTQFYDDPAHPHAVSRLSTGETFGYDANGNMTTRVEGGITYAQAFDAENRLTSVTANGQTTQFVYDGDGQLVKRVAPDGTVTVYIGSLYEVQTAGGGGPTPTPTASPTATPAGGTRLKDITFEDGDLTHPASGADSKTGTVTLETAAPLKGGYSARIPDAGSSYLQEDFAAADDLYVSFYFTFDALAGSTRRIARLLDGSALMGNLTLLSSGALRLKLDTTAVGADSAPLSPGTLYRIGLRQKQGTGANAVLEAYLAVGDAPFGAPFAATTVGNWTAAPNRLRVGATDSDALAATLDDIRLDTAAMPGPSGGGGATPTPTASPTAPPPSGTHTTSYYALPGATGVRADGVVSYVLTDHLGSASVVLNTSGAVTAEQRYLPFGESRLTATLPTDRLYTGQLQLASLNLYHFGARAYSPALGRFVSADTIVPDWTDPQSLNRYSYVVNNPLLFVDPTGYVYLCDEACEASYAWRPPLSAYGVTLVGLTSVERLAVTAAVQDVGSAIMASSPGFATSAEAFASTFGTSAESPLQLARCPAGGCSKLGYTRSSKLIWFNPFVYSQSSYPGEWWERTVHLVVHELGHAFNAQVVNVVGAGLSGLLGPYNQLARTQASDPTYPRRGDDPYGSFGFAGPRYNWQQSPDASPGEEFADQFIGWTYGRWESLPNGLLTLRGQARSDWMGARMPLWISLAAATGTGGAP